MASASGAYLTKHVLTDFLWQLNNYLTKDVYIFTEQYNYLNNQPHHKIYLEFMEEPFFNQRSHPECHISEISPISSSWKGHHFTFQSKANIWNVYKTRNIEEKENFFYHYAKYFRSCISSSTIAVWKTFCINNFLKISCCADKGALSLLKY